MQKTYYVYLDSRLSTLKMEAIHFSETSVSSYRNTWHNISGTLYFYYEEVPLKIV
jgi:hypothetical protein